MVYTHSRMGARFPPKMGSVFPQYLVSSCIALFLTCIVMRYSSILFALVSCVYFMYFAGFEDVCRPRPTIHVFDTRFKSSLSILHDTCKYLHPNLDPFETCTIHDNTWPILGFFVWSVSVVFCVYLEGLFDTHRYLTLLGYIKIPPNTTKYIWGNTYPTFGGNRTQAHT